MVASLGVLVKNALDLMEIVVVILGIFTPLALVWLLMRV